jgi:hypothetical protein
MSIVINNAGSPLEYHSIPKRINAAIVNISLDRLKELYPDIQRFSYYPAPILVTDQDLQQVDQDTPQQPI